MKLIEKEVYLMGFCTSKEYFKKLERYIPGSNKNSDFNYICNFCSIVKASSVDCDIPYYKIIEKFIEVMDKERKKYSIESSQLDKQLDFVRKSLRNLETKSLDDYNDLILKYEERIIYYMNNLEEVSSEVYFLKYYQLKFFISAGEEKSRI